jgi:hypothetical protein
MRRFTTLALVLALVLAAVALSGCGAIAQKATEAAVEKTTGVKVDTNSGTITTTDKDGNQSTLSTAEGSYPDGFPSDFPQYPGGTVDSGLKSTTDGQDAFTVIVTTPDAAKDVYDWYTAELEKGGWKIDQSMDGTNSDPAFASISVSKGDQKGGVTISRDTDKNITSIMIGLGPNKQ